MEIRFTETFLKWFRKLRDPIARRAINARLTRLSATGLFGDVKRLGRVSEMRIDAGPGYRLYYTIRGSEIVFILAGGDKSTQQKDFQLANLLAEQDFDFE